MNADVCGLFRYQVLAKPALDTSRKLASLLWGVEAYVAYWPWQEADTARRGFPEDTARYAIRARISLTLKGTAASASSPKIEAKSCSLRAFSSITFSSIVSRATSR